MMKHLLCTSSSSQTQEMGSARPIFIQKFPTFLNCLCVTHRKHLGKRKSVNFSFPADYIYLECTVHSASVNYTTYTCHSYISLEAPSESMHTSYKFSKVSTTHLVLPLPWATMASSQLQHALKQQLPCNQLDSILHFERVFGIISDSVVRHNFLSLHPHNMSCDQLTYTSSKRSDMSFLLYMTCCTTSQ